MSRLGLYFRTLRYLRPEQLRGQLANRLRAQRWRPRALREEPTLRGALAPVTVLPPSSSMVSSDLTFTFLNASASLQVRPGAVDWAARSMSRLWRYNLHYFDYLLDESVSDDLKAGLIDDWIANNPPGTADAWDPYPVSLRIVNWVKYLLRWAQHRPLPRPWLMSLYAQAAWLTRRFEYHLLANHLLKNAVALFFAGCFFDGPEAEAWVRRGWQEFAAQVQEQFLADGGHFERSPMYHALCLADCLDVLALASQPPVAERVNPPPELLARVRAAADFLRDICFPDGDIPLFNDAAFGVAAAPQLLLARANAVLGCASGAGPSPGGPGCELINKPMSGYFGFRRGADMLLVDCGAVGPDYQPGHAHCDCLSYELVLDGARLIVDSGVYDYEQGERRRLCRSTAGHNTVRLDGCEQSEIWGVFRVGRRARPLGALLRAAGDGGTFEGAHDGYRRLPGKPVHLRRIAWDGNAAIDVCDEVSGGAGEHTAESRIRLHPAYKAVLCDNYAMVTGSDDKLAARIEFTDGLNPQLEEGRYFPRFGVELRCTVLILTACGRLPLRLGYRIIRPTRA